MQISETVLVVIAVALCVQALISIALIAVVLREWRRMYSLLDGRLATLSGRLDELIRPAGVLADELRTAAVAVTRCSDTASGMLQGSGRIAQAVIAAVGGRRSVVVTGALTALSHALGRWRGTRRSESGGARVQPSLRRRALPGKPIA